MENGETIHLIWSYLTVDFISPDLRFLLGNQKSLKLRCIWHLQPIAEKCMIIQSNLCKPAARERTNMNHIATTNLTKENALIK
jgi:hypothetical protein